MISPTGKGIRSDSEGDGHYGSSRGSRIHRGVDFLADSGQEIVAPFDMTIKRIAYPYRDMTMIGIEWIRGKSSGKMFYFDPIIGLIGSEVKQDQVIGFAQGVSEYHNLPNMKNHIHFQVDK